MIFQALAEKERLPRWIEIYHGKELTIEHRLEQKTDGSLRNAWKAGEAMLDALRANPDVADRLVSAKTTLTGPGADPANPLWSIQFKSPISSSNQLQVDLVVYHDMFVKPPAGTTFVDCIGAALGRAPTLKAPKGMPGTRSFSLQTDDTGGLLITNEGDPFVIPVSEISHWSSAILKTK